MDYDREVRMAEIEGERRALLDLARVRARLAYQQVSQADDPEVSAGQLRLVIG